MQMDTPLPPASIWEQFPEISIIILVSLVLVGVFIWYNERREKAWQGFLNTQRQASETAQTAQLAAYNQVLEDQQEYWKEQRKDDRQVMNELVKEIRSFRIDHQEHDVRMLQAISKMEERTRPSRKTRSAP